MATERNDLEKYFEWWLNELLEHGYIRSYDREAEKFPLFPNYVALRLKFFKTREPEEEEFNFMHNRFYNYDYNIKWTEKSRNIFFQEADFSNPNKRQLFVHKGVYFTAHWNHEERCHISYVDVKPPAHGGSGRKNDSYITFPLKQQILLWLQGIYINKVVPFPMQGSGKTTSLFPNTFTPQRYTITDAGRQTRKIRFNIMFLNQYVEKRKKEIKQVEENIFMLSKKSRPEGETGQTSLL